MEISTGPSPQAFSLSFALDTIMYSQPLLLLLAILFADFTVACSHNGAAAAGHVVRSRRSLQRDPVQPVRRAQTTPVAITNVKYITGKGLSALSTIQFSNGIITAILPGGNTGVPPNFKVVNGNGSTLLPGLVESHTHPTNIAELQTLTTYGITTSLGMGCPYIDNCDALRRQSGLSDFYSAGIAATTPGSVHATILALPPQDLIYNATQAPSWVRARIAEGSNYIKLIAETPGLSQDEHNAIVSAAHSNGKQTATHAAQLDNYQQAITSKTDNIQHAPLDGVLSAAQVKIILAQGQTVTPTLAILRKLVVSPFNPPGGTYANAQQSVTALNKAGVTILCGTDSDDVLGPYATAYGSSMYDELENLVQAGLSPVQALNSATSLPAQRYGFNDRGTIAVGKRADLLLVGGDPTINVSNARNIKNVWATGIAVTPAA